MDVNDAQQARSARVPRSDAVRTNTDPDKDRVSTRHERWLLNSIVGTRAPLDRPRRR
jgi:hypothetical protein